MKIVACLSLAFAVSAQAMNHELLADAIWRAEGGDKARKPYGILSVSVRDDAHARQVCLRTIASAKARWDGRTDFIAHLAGTYCPVQSDRDGHFRWIRNVRRIYKQKWTPAMKGK